MGRAVGAFFTAFLLGIVALPMCIRFFRRKKVEQILRGKDEVRDLADLHARKAHTPTMGGICIWAAAVASALFWGKINSLLLAALFIFTAFAAIGFADDFLKLRRRSSTGISGRKKLLLQAIGVGALLVALRLWDGELYGAVHGLWIPLRTTALIPHMATVLVLAFAFLVMAGSANAVNLTDGADGLAAGCSIVTTCSFAALALSVDRFSSETFSAVPGAGELAILLLALAGALLAFFCYNCPPAKIFMGDTGSLAIGGLFGAVAFLLRQPFLLAIIGGVFVAEALSVMAQVYYFKCTGGRRIFRMAPLHHHFELGGCPESRVVGRFLVAAALCAATGLALHFFPQKLH
jgi:phospho-N-acetylmuramoyl-pentapeptide-transferase